MDVLTWRFKSVRLDSNSWPLAPKATGHHLFEHDRNQNVLLDGDGFANMAASGLPGDDQVGRAVTDSEDSSGAKPESTGELG
jgi:hypothetical protein